MQNTLRTIPAGALAVLLLTYSGSVFGQSAEKKQPPPGNLVGPMSPSGWYLPAEFDNAVQAAETLGQPLAVMYQDSNSTCPKHNVQREVWLRAPELAGFVRVMVDSKTINESALLRQWRRDAADRAGHHIPILFLGDTSGKVLGVVPYKTLRPQFQTAIAGTLKAFGPTLPPKTAMNLWKNLEKARAHWENGKIDAALTCYMVVKREESKNPKLPIFAELGKDEQRINEKGAEEVAAVETLLRANKRGEARTAIAAIRRRYAGFQPAKDAKALLDTFL